MPRKAKTIEDVNKSITRWKAKFRRAVNALQKLDAQKKSITSQRHVTMIAIAAPVNSGDTERIRLSGKTAADHIDPGQASPLK